MSTILDLVQLVNQFAAESQRLAQLLAAKEEEIAKLKSQLAEATKPKV